MGHPDHDLVRARRGGELDRLVEHRHHHVEALERELLLPEERAAQVLLEALDLREPARGARMRSSARERLAVAARLDRLAQPDALFVVGDVLELVGDRAAVDLAQRGQRLGERLARRRGRGAREAGMRAWSSGVSGGISRDSARARGRPSGSEPSGSRRAARWPCMRCALTSAMAAATPPSSVSSTRRAAGAGRRLPSGRRAARGAGVPVPVAADARAGAAGRDATRRARCRRSRRARATPAGRRRGSRGTPRAAVARSRRSARRRRACSQQVFYQPWARILRVG